MTLTNFLLGAVAATSVVAALLFARAWRLSRDRLFLFFALAFGSFALNWVGLVLFAPNDVANYQVYLPRLAGFVLIIAGVLDKNRRVQGRDETSHDDRRSAYDR